MVCFRCAESLWHVCHMCSWMHERRKEQSYSSHPPDTASCSRSWRTGDLEIFQVSDLTA